MVLRGFGLLAAEDQDWERVATLLAAAEATDGPWLFQPAVYETERGEAIARGREAFGARFDELYEAGRTVSREEAVTLARETVNQR